jgi:hypothetical protein
VEHPDSKVGRSHTPLGEVRGDLTGGQAFGVQRDRHRIHIRQPPLPLPHDHRLESAGPVPGHLHAHFTGSLGQHRLGPGAVTDIPWAALGRRVVLVVAQVLGHLLLERGLQHGGGDRLQQPVGAGQVLTTGAGGLDQLAHRGPLRFTG